MKRSVIFTFGMLLLVIGGACWPRQAMAGAVLPQSSHVVAYWSFDADGTDDSNNAHTALATGKPTFGIAGPTGKNTGTAVYLDGNDWFDVTDDGSLNLTGSMTMAYWINVDQITNDWSAIIHKGTHSLSYYRTYSMWINDNRYMHLTSGVGNFQYTANSVPGSVPLDTWVHMVGVVDRTAGRLRTYFNGMKVAEDALNTSSAYGHNGSLRIGNDRESSSGYSPFKGSLDELALWNTALNDAEVSTLYNNYSVFAEPVPAPLAVVGGWAMLSIIRYKRRGMT